MMNRPSSQSSAPPHPPGLQADVPGPERRADSEWVARQVETIADALHRGESFTVEDLLAGHPDLDDETAIRLIYEDVCLRRDAGQEVATHEVVGRFPRWKDELEILLDCDRLLRPLGTAVSWPEVGSGLGPYRLCAELGRGASGRTFLATELDLAERPVVLKVVPDDQDEHLSLARLQHTHIVPLFSEQTFPERGLRGLCMPYLGGASLARILEEIGDIPLAKRRGFHIVECLERSEALGFLPARVPGSGPFRRYLEEASYVDAICWIAACLADALEYAHARGLFHMDVKPSNVLIAGDGQPMLLDFHLARGPMTAGDWAVGRVGGTPDWMSPEQHGALEATRLGRPIPASLDGRSDIYALGRLLREALAGPEPTPAPPSRVDPGPAGVSVGLRDIIAKCLSADPALRYPEAAALADDLRRHLNDLPLAGVPNRSLTERWRKWRRRSPGTLARGTAWASSVAGLVVTASLLGAVYRQAADSVRADLDEGRRLRVEKKLPEAIRTLSRGLERTGTVPLVAPLRRALGEQLDLARRGQQAAELHELADLIRFRYGLAPPSTGEADTLVRLFGSIWESRHRLLASHDHPLDPETVRTVRTDLTELALVWADLRVRLAPPRERVDARRDALRILDEAGASVGSSPALDRERRGLARSLGQPVPADEPGGPPSTAWEHYDLGRSYLRAGRIREACQEFHRTLETRPQDFWSNFYEGLCSYHLGRFDDAVSAFRTCIALAPGASQCYYNRALAADSLGRSDRAWADYSRALELDPRLAAAALNRGILSYRTRHYGQARADFLRALAATSDRPTLGQIHYNLALAEHAEGDRASALAGARKAVDLGCREARDLLDRLQHGS